MTRWNLNRLQKHGIIQCMKCLQKFNEDDVVATSSSKMYCYNCATRINLVSGKIENDLNNDQLVSNTIHYIESVGKELGISTSISKLSIILVTTAMQKKKYISKNEIGIACASILLAHKIRGKFISDKFLPLSKISLQKNLHSLQKNLVDVDISVFSKIICEMKN